MNIVELRQTQISRFNNLPVGEEMLVVLENNEVVSALKVDLTEFMAKLAATQPVLTFKKIAFTKMQICESDGYVICTDHDGMEVVADKGDYVLTNMVETTEDLDRGPLDFSQLTPAEDPYRFGVGNTPDVRAAKFTSQYLVINESAGIYLRKNPNTGYLYEGPAVVFSPWDGAVMVAQTGALIDVNRYAIAPSSLAAGYRQVDTQQS